MKGQITHRKRPGRSVFTTIFISVLVILFVEIALLMASLNFSRVSEQLDQNAEDILDKQVENRCSYLESFLVGVQDLTDLSEKINAQTQRLVDSGVIDMDELDAGSASSEPLLQAVAPSLVDTLRSKNATGIFVVLSTHDLDSRASGDRLPGIYVRDLDPDAPRSARNEDLMLEFAPAPLVQSMRISTDSFWEPALTYDKDKTAFVYAPFERAWQDGASLSAADYGRWTTESYTVGKDTRRAVAYSEPLILSDGTVYGVIGVELLTDYVQDKIPYSELQNNGRGAYLLAYTEDSLTAKTFTLSGVTASATDSALRAQGTALTYQRSGMGGRITVDGQSYYGCAMPLTLYSRNAPFSGEHWMLLGMAAEQELYGFSRDVQHMLVLTVLLTLGVGFACSLIVSRRLARPITQLSEEVAAVQDKNSAIPQLSITGIRELDQFSSEITRLSRDILDTSTKFLRIMKMASVELGGYEIRPDSDTVYVTENFFSMLGLPPASAESLTQHEFEKLMENLVLTRESIGLSRGGCVFTIPQADGSERYVLLRIACENDVQVGLVEDVTASTIEQRRIEHERDYDVLTGLYNRRAFQRACDKLFMQPDRLGHAALLMMDMDNLKHFNDTFGHDWGDRYICMAGQCIAKNTPVRTVSARLSGDEFVVLYYGYDRRDDIRRELKRLYEGMKEESAELPDGEQMRVCISGGVAWYPEDSEDMEELRKFADFAMYQVKRSAKGGLCEFDAELYRQEACAAEQRHEFMQILNGDHVNYHFQPIFSARTGETEAYEALMRVDMPSLHSPATVMRLAREQNKLYEIEYLTLFHASEQFISRRQSGVLKARAKLFLNTIASVSLNDADWGAYYSRYQDLLPEVVVEITEEEAPDSDVLDRKRRLMNGVGEFALDDYGSGYSNSNMLLELAPAYIKVDIGIISGIDTDPDKQQVAEGIISYAHAHGMKIVAEGIETAGELRAVIALGADLLQGYFLGRPAAEPADIAPEARQIIDEMRDDRTE